MRQRKELDNSNKEAGAENPGALIQDQSEQVESS